MRPEERAQRALNYLTAPGVGPVDVIAEAIGKAVAEAVAAEKVEWLLALKVKIQAGPCPENACEHNSDGSDWPCVACAVERATRRIEDAERGACAKVMDLRAIGHRVALESGEAAAFGVIESVSAAKREAEKGAAAIRSRGKEAGVDARTQTEGHTGPAAE